jgi:hypothetical protein
VVLHIWTCKYKLKDGQSTKRINWKNEVMPAIEGRPEAFNSRGIIATLCAMFYAPVPLQVINNLQPHYHYLSHFTARARENGEHPINCFADQSRQIIGG